MESIVNFVCIGLPVIFAGTIISMQLEKIRKVMEATARHNRVPEYIKKPEESQ